MIVSRKISKLGNHSSDTAEFIFDNVRVPTKNLIGEMGKGFTYQMLQFQDERLVAAATSTLLIHFFTKTLLDNVNRARKFRIL